MTNSSDDKNSNTENYSFWKHNKIISILVFLAIGIPIFLILSSLNPSNLLFPELNIGNSIALLAAGIAIAGTFYSNYRNDIRNQNQLNHNELQLKKQLVFNEKQKVMLELYDILYKHKNSIKELTSESTEFKNYDITAHRILSERSQLFTELKKVQENIYKFFYIPQDIQNKIDDFIKFINMLPNENSNSLEIFKNAEIKNYLTKIYYLVEEDLGIDFNRDYFVIKPGLNIYGY